MSIEDTIIEHLNKAGITNTIEQNMFLAQMGHESQNFTRKYEGLYYTTEDRLKAIYPHLFKNKYNPKDYLRNPEKLANLVYDDANRLPGYKVGNTEPGDGWKYRGRGITQLTGKANYIDAGKRLGLDLVNNPDLIINDPEIDRAVAVDFWKNNVNREAAQRGDVKTVTRNINGGLNGLDDRSNRFNKLISERSPTELEKKNLELANVDNTFTEGQLEDTPLVSEDTIQPNNQIEVAKKEPSMIDKLLFQPAQASNPPVNDVEYQTFLDGLKEPKRTDPTKPPDVRQFQVSDAFNNSIIGAITKASMGVDMDNFSRAFIVGLKQGSTEKDALKVAGLDKDADDVVAGLVTAKMTKLFGEIGFALATFNNPVIGPIALASRVGKVGTKLFPAAKNASGFVGTFGKYATAHGLNAAVGDFTINKAGNMVSNIAQGLPATKDQDAVIGGAAMALAAGGLVGGGVATLAHAAAKRAGAGLAAAGLEEAADNIAKGVGDEAINQGAIAARKIATTLAQHRHSELEAARRTLNTLLQDPTPVHDLSKGPFKEMLDTLKNVSRVYNNTPSGVKLDFFGDAGKQSDVFGQLMDRLKPMRRFLLANPRSPEAPISAGGKQIVPTMINEGEAHQIFTLTKTLADEAADAAPGTALHMVGKALKLNKADTAAGKAMTSRLRKELAPSTQRVLNDMDTTFRRYGDVQVPTESGMKTVWDSFDPATMQLDPKIPDELLMDVLTNSTKMNFSNVPQVLGDLADTGLISPQDILKMYSGANVLKSGAPTVSTLPTESVSNIILEEVAEQQASLIKQAKAAGRDLLPSETGIPIERSVDGVTQKILNNDIIFTPEGMAIKDVKARIIPGSITNTRRTSGNFNLDSYAKEVLDPEKLNSFAKSLGTKHQNLLQPVVQRAQNITEQRAAAQAARGMAARNKMSFNIRLQKDFPDAIGNQSIRELEDLGSQGLQFNLIKGLQPLGQQTGASLSDIPFSLESQANPLHRIIDFGASTFRNRRK